MSSTHLSWNGPHPDATRNAPEVRIERIGGEAEPVIVVDGFSGDPARWIESASQGAMQAIGPHYPGLRRATEPDYLAAVGPLLAKLIGTVFGYPAGAHVAESWYSIVTTPPARLQPIQRLPHFDGVEDARLAVLHFLCDPGHGGTAFYRHRSTGFETVDADRYPIYARRLAEDVRGHGLPQAGYIDGDTALFERIAEFPGAPDRALIYRGKLLHCARIAPGANLSADPRCGRLTVNSFLTPAAAG